MRKEHDVPRVVLDTNVLLSALGFEGKETVKIWELAQAGRIHVFVSAFILWELERNLVKKAAFTSAEARALVAGVLQVARTVAPVVAIQVIKRKDSDNRILECAVAANADVLVTGNMRDLLPLASFQGIKILKPREFMDTYFLEERS